MRGIDLLKDIGYIDDSLVQEAVLDVGASKVTKTIQWSKWTRWGSVAAGFVVLCVAAVALRQGTRSYDATESASVDTAAVYSVTDSVTEEVYVEDAKEEAKEIANGASSTTTSTTSESAKTEEVSDMAADMAAQEEGNKETMTIISEYSKTAEVDGETAKMEVSVCYATPEKGEYFYFYELEEAMNAYAGQAVQYYVTIDVFEEGEQLRIEVIYGGDEPYDKNSPLIKEYERLLAEGYEVIIEEDELRGYFTEEELKTFAVNAEYGYAFHFTEDY